MQKKSNLLMVFFVFILTITTGFVFAQQLQTPAEAINYIQYTQHEEITKFLSVLDHQSIELNVLVAGQSYPTREYPAKDLYLCIITEEGIDQPEKLNRTKPTILIVAAKHGNEQSAKESCLRIIRDLTQGDLKPLLKNANFLVLPTINPFGNWFDQRRNGQDLDLNRDHVKLEAPETRTINRIFRDWMPEVTLDVHEKGDDYYRVSTGCVSNVNIHPNLQEFSRNFILLEINNALKDKKITFQEYLITQRMGIDSSAGVTYRSEDMERSETMKRFSTTDLNDGRNSPGIYETLSFIQEGSSRHDLETLRERTEWQYYGIRCFAESVARHGEKIIDLVRAKREYLKEKASNYSDSDMVHLRMKYAREKNQPSITINKFDRDAVTIRGILKVDKKAGDPLFREDIAPAPRTGEKITEEVVKNWFPNVEPVISVSRPLGYILPATRYDIIETLLHHGFEISFFNADILLEIEVYQVSDFQPAEYDYLPPQKIELEKKSMKVLVKKGDYYITCVQDGANLIPCLLEPQSQYGFIRYWKYKLAPEKGDVFPFYRVIEGRTLPLIPYKNWSK